MSEIITVPEERTLGMISLEIRTLQQQAQQVVLGYAIEIGRRLTEAKAMVSHGAWGDWLREEVRYSKSTANNFMRIFDAYGSEQMGLFGPEAKSQTLGNLPYTKALQLLALPEEEREAFAEENHVDELSTRELDRLIRERKEAIDGKEKAEKKAQETAELLEAAENGKKSLQDEIQRIQKETADAMAAARAEAEQAKADAEDAKKKTEAAEKKAKTAAERLKKLQDNPEIPEDAMEKIRREAQEDAQKATAEKLDAKLKEAAHAEEMAKEKARMAEERASAAEKKLKMADADTILFKAEAERLQETFGRCHGMLLKIKANEEEIGKKLSAYLMAVLENMKGRIG